MTKTVQPVAAMVFAGVLVIGAVVAICVLLITGHATWDQVGTLLVSILSAVVGACLALIQPGQVQPSTPALAQPSSAGSANLTPTPAAPSGAVLTADQVTALRQGQLPAGVTVQG